MNPRATARFYRQTCRHIYGFRWKPPGPLLPIRGACPGIQSRSLLQPDERQEVPSTRLSGRRPRSTVGAQTSTARARTGRPCGSAPNLAGWPSQHQHAGLPRGRSLCAMRHGRLGRGRPRQPVSALCGGPPRVLTVHVLRPRQPLRVHATDSCPCHTKEREEFVHVLHGQDDRRTGNYSAAL
jgi:hypothetical protein